MATWCFTAQRMMTARAISSLGKREEDNDHVNDSEVIGYDEDEGGYDYDEDGLQEVEGDRKEEEEEQEQLEEKEDVEEEEEEEEEESLSHRTRRRTRTWRCRRNPSKLHQHQWQGGAHEVPSPRAARRHGSLLRLRRGSHWSPHGSYLSWGPKRDRRPTTGASPTTTTPRTMMMMKLTKMTVTIVTMVTMGMTIEVMRTWMGERSVAIDDAQWDMETEEGWRECLGVVPKTGGPNECGGEDERREDGRGRRKRKNENKRDITNRKEGGYGFNCPLRMHECCEIHKYKRGHTRRERKQLEDE